MPEPNEKGEPASHQPPDPTLDESMIEKQHQYQMFPTPDEKRASKVITRLSD